MHGVFHIWESLEIKVTPAELPVFAEFSWWWFLALVILLLFSMVFIIHRKHKMQRNKHWNDYFVEPPEYLDPVKVDKDEVKNQDLFSHYFRRFMHKKSTELLKVRDDDGQMESAKTDIGVDSEKNYYLWDDGMIFCGFKLQGTDFRRPDLYGAYLRDMFLRDRSFIRSNTPLIFNNAEAYAAVDMSGTFLRNELMRDIALNRADWGQVDLSGLYLRSIGLQGIDPSEFLKPDEKSYSDYFLPESYRDKGNR
jgi:hypothetical protein